MVCMLFFIMEKIIIVFARDMWLWNANGTCRSVQICTVTRITQEQSIENRATRVYFCRYELEIELWLKNRWARRFRIESRMHGQLGAKVLWFSAFLQPHWSTVSSGLLKLALFFLCSALPKSPGIPRCYSAVRKVCLLHLTLGTCKVRIFSKNLPRETPSIPPSLKPYTSCRCSLISISDSECRRVHFSVPFARCWYFPSLSMITSWHGVELKESWIGTKLPGAAINPSTI